MYKRGLVIGKFYPPHRGHKLLIDTAQNLSEDLTVIICWKPEEHIEGSLRAQWLRQIHPRATIIAVRDTVQNDNDSKGWAAFTKELLGYTPDAVFTSEDYGDRYGEYLNAAHVLVDKKREKVPISGTKVREDPLKNFKYLEPCVRAHFAKRIVILGAESTGTTTLAKDLADHYATAWVPEYGRLYSEGKINLDKTWRTEEFETIAREQNALEDALAKECSGILICDTDSWATAIWHERYMGCRSEAVEKIARSHDLYILTGDEIPFEQDGTRDGEHIRHWMHKRFEERLRQEGKRYAIVRGSKKERLKKAISAIDEYLSVDK